MIGTADLIVVNAGTGAGADVLFDPNGGALAGNNGDDIYIITQKDQSVTENSGQGKDKIFTTLDEYSLGNNIELLSYKGEDDFTGTGNDLANGNDTLDGKAGIDKLLSGPGDDTLIYDSADSKIDGGTGTDTLKLNDSGITLDLNKLTFGKISSIEKLDLTGASNNSLLVNTANLAGADGHELYVIGDAGDSVTLSKTLWEKADDLKVNDVNYHQYIQITGSQTDHVYVLEAVTQNLV